VRSATRQKKSGDGKTGRGLTGRRRKSARGWRRRGRSMKQAEKLVSRRSARRMLSESGASSRSWSGTVADGIAVAADATGPPSVNAIDHGIEAGIATGDAVGAGVGRGHASAQSPSSQRISRWMTIWLSSSCYRRVSRWRNLANGRL
jgi:hypothetical protein